MHGYSGISIEPFAECFFSRNVRITFVRPVNEQRFADNFVPSYESPISAVVAVVAIVTHDEVMVRRYRHRTEIIADFELFWGPGISRVDGRVDVNLIRL